MNVAGDADHLPRRPGTPADAVDGVVPAWVAEPGDLDAVRRVVAAASERREPLIASGRGRHLDVGAVPRPFATLLRLTRLERVLAYEPADMTVTVEAGCTLAALATRLAAAGQWLPIDAPVPDDTTIGGLIAANLSGPLRASQGIVRDALLGLTVVGADGVVARGGGRVVKNVAGYDLPKVHVGALGSLGVIVEATFKVRPRFPCEAAVSFAVSDLSSACELGLALRDLVEPTWLEIVHPAGLLEAGASGTLVVVGTGGATAWVEAAGERVARMAAGSLASRHADGAAVRRALGDLMVRPAAALIRVSTLATEAGSCVAPIVEALARDGVRLDLTVHVASGVSRLGVRRADQVATVLRHLREAAPDEALIVVERATPSVKAEVDVWGRVRSGEALMTGVKRAFDPADVFSSGRFVAGL